MSLTLTQIVNIAAANDEFVPGMSSNEFFYANQTNERLTDVIATIADEVRDRAMIDHTHNYAPADHTHDYAPAEHEHDYAASSHTHDPSEIADLFMMLDERAILLDGKVPEWQLPSYVDDVEEHENASDFPEEGESGKIYIEVSTNKTYRWGGSTYVEITGGLALGETAATAYRGDFGKIAYDHSQNGSVHVTEAQKANWDSKAPNNHIHTGYALEDHDHSEYAPASHGHSGYASANHDHDNYAITDHTHDDYFSVNGGTIEGDTTVNGVFRVEGQQAFYYNTTNNTQTIGTNNATGGTNIGCGSSANVVVNGAIMKAPMILPRANNTFTCGNANFRWSGIYSTAAVNVSSDERLKRDIELIDADSMVEFIKNLNVVSYNYKDDSVDAKSRIGLIAQQVRQAGPDVADFFVSEDENGMLGLTPSDLVFPLIMTVQCLSAELEELKSKM